uniref:Uncharacterized protein n=1 Tax=Zea mays TaxID=4577 RepID=B6TYU5_MAIZE|nr:hypothetical protein [Zea mays]
MPPPNGRAVLLFRNPVWLLCTSGCIFVDMVCVSFKFRMLLNFFSLH